MASPVTQRETERGTRSRTVFMQVPTNPTRFTGVHLPPPPASKTLPSSYHLLPSLQGSSHVQPLDTILKVVSRLRASPYQANTEGQAWAFGGGIQQVSLCWPLPSQKQRHGSVSPRHLGAQSLLPSQAPASHGPAER